MAKSFRRSVDMTTGSLFRKILLFTVPLVLTNILQQLYNVADMVIVGRFSSVDGAVGAIGSTTSFHSLMLNLIIGLSVGATVVVSQAIGARDEEKARHGVHTSLVLGFLFGVGILIIAQVICRPMLVLINTEPQYMAMAEEYCRIFFMGVPFVAVLNCALGIMRAQGDTTRPLLILAGAGLLNVLLNIVFVAGCGMDVDGVALATLVANIVSTMAALICLVRDRGICRLRMKALRIHRATAKRVLLVGVPSGVQGMLFSSSNMIIQSAVNGFGPAAITAAAIATNLQAFGYTAGNSAAQASMTFTGQNTGAKNYRRIPSVVHNSMLVGVLLSGVIAVALYLFQEPLAGLYMNEATENREEILAVLRPIATAQVLTVPLCGLMECGALALRGMGYSTLSMINSLVGSCLLRIVWVYTVFAAFPSVIVLYINYPLTWSITAAAQYIFVRQKCRKLIAASERV